MKETRGAGGKVEKKIVQLHSKTSSMNRLVSFELLKANAP
jgi:hypothetical protein